MKNIAVLTSGGDSPGMNAAIRAVVRSCIYYKVNVFGVQRGYQGLIDDDISQMSVYSVADIIQKGGTVLRTARCAAMFESAGVKKAAAALKKRNINSLVVIGGDGSYKGAKALFAEGINVVGVPATIDNDIALSEKTIGFDTAVNTVIEAISKIRDTSLSHNRINIVQVMGRKCGNIALYAGIAGGAEAIIVPEIKTDVEAICKKTLAGKDRGKLHSIMVFAEGAGDMEKFSKEVASITGMEVKHTVLGYIQRGGSPSALDRIIASRMGAMAVKVLLEGKSNRAISLRGENYIDDDMDNVLNTSLSFDIETYKTAMRLSI